MKYPHTGFVEPTFFATPAGFRDWLEVHHADAPELLVGYYKKGSGRASMTWPESVDEALCFGWIDGIRRRIDDERYSIRFTPRRARSVWSAVNIRRAGELIAEGRMTPAGLAAFEARDEARSAIYSYEQRHKAKLDPEQERLLRELAKLRGEERPTGQFQPGQQGLFSRLKDAFNGG